MKIYILLFLFFTITTNLISQNFSGYINLGISGSQVSGDNLSGFNKAGVIFGIGTNRLINNNKFFNIELNYIEKGSHNPKLYENNIPEINLSYLEIPMSFGITNNKNSYSLGLSYGTLINSKEKDQYGEINNNRRFKDYDVSIFGSFEYQLKKNIYINLTLSNTLLFTPIRNHSSNISLWYNKGQYNTILAFTIKYYIIKFK